MMTPFLRQAAAHYISLGALDETCLVFPSRRASVFFTKYLRELLAGSSRPVILPKMMTESEFFAAIYGHPVSDRLSLLLELYSVYKECNPKCESLDEFVFWGDVILSDFSDVDKYLVDPEQLFTNVAEYKDIRDTFSYLSERQREAINAFLSHFRDGGGELPEGKAVYKDRFLGLWNLLLPVYRLFRQRLKDKGMAYDGMVYRCVAECFESESAEDIISAAFSGVRLIGFVGLNALNECEKKVLGRLRDASLADFSWDYCGRMIRDKFNRSSFFMEQNVAAFPMTWSLLPVPDAPGRINVVSVPSAVGQAKLLPRMIGNPESTAVVLPDESLLQPVLNTIPPEIERINVTMGLPLTQSRFHSLMSDIMSMQLRSRVIRGESYFYHKNVWSILTSGIIGEMLSEEEKNLVSQLRSAGKYYIPESDLSATGPLARAIFVPLNLAADSSDASQTRRFGEYLRGTVSLIASKMVELTSLASETEFAMRWYACVSSILEKEIPVGPSTYSRLLLNLLAMQSVPFEGEPIGGLQIMGPLETRALDFDNVIILSCNEGMFPRRSVSSSFVPPALRLAFGMPTYEYQDAIWAYYFYRMICRAETVWLLYDSRTEGVRGGEESRYIKQLQYHFRLPLHRMATGLSLGTVSEEDHITKPADIAERLRETTLSASSILNYLSCQAKFYYSSIEKLKPDEDVTESLDARMIGNVFHETMYKLYQIPGKVITADYIDGLLSRQGRGKIRSCIEECIKEAIHSPEISGRNLVFADIIQAYVVRTLTVDRKLVPIQILGLEKEKHWYFEGYKFFGYIDRLDRVDGRTRVIDYKTGRDKPEDIIIGNPEAVVRRIFEGKDSERPKIALQLFFYDMFVLNGKDAPSIDEMYNCMYPVPKIATEGIAQTRLSREFMSLVLDRLKELLAEMADPLRPFLRTSDVKTCENCDFKSICGR